MREGLAIRQDPKPRKQPRPPLYLVDDHQSAQIAQRQHRFQSPPLTNRILQVAIGSTPLFAEFGKRAICGHQKEKTGKKTAKSRQNPIKYWGITPSEKYGSATGNRTRV